MSKVPSALEKAIIARAMKDPVFMAHLLADPAGCLKALAAEDFQPEPGSASPWGPLHAPGRGARIQH